MNNKAPTKCACHEKFDRKTNEEILGEVFHYMYMYTSWPLYITELQTMAWHSDVYKHYQKLILITSRGKIKYKFICKKWVAPPISTIDKAEAHSRNPSISLLRGQFEDSTANLNRHIRQCDLDITPSSQKMRAFANGATYSPMCFRFLLAMWCARRHWPFKIVLDPELGDIFQMLYDHVDIPHPMTVSHDVNQIYNISKEQVANALQVS